MSHSAGGNTAEPNLVPILDMVFQLITFFMLVINVKTAATDINVEVPLVGSAAPVDSKEEDKNMLVLNINSKGKLFVQGKEKEDISAYIKAEGAAAQASAGIAAKDLKPDYALPVTIVFRAAADTPFELLYPVIRTCQEQGFRKFHYMYRTKDS